MKWGILGTAGIARKAFMPAIMRTNSAQAWAVGARSLRGAQLFAANFDLVRAHGSYDALLADPQVQAVYNPLPNHLHIPMTLAALRAGKHVLCEKPLALDPTEIDSVIAASRETGCIAAEGYMVHYHPQWAQARAWIAEGRIGSLCHIESHFTYFNSDPNNIRNQADIGGGGLYDIGVYPVVTARMLLEQEPVRVACAVSRDPLSGVDSMANALVDFGDLRLSFYVATQAVHSQAMRLHGTKGVITLPKPFNPPVEGKYSIHLQHETGVETALYEDVDQFALQIKAFSQAVNTQNSEPLFQLTDSIQNAQVIDALQNAARSGRWERL